MKELTGRYSGSERANELCHCLHLPSNQCIASGRKLLFLPMRGQRWGQPYFPIIFTDLRRKAPDLNRDTISILLKKKRIRYVDDSLTS